MLNCSGQCGLETAKLVKKYRGSLAENTVTEGLRGEFIPLILGEANYELLKKLKAAWDPENILNPGKIVDTPLMNTFPERMNPGQLLLNWKQCMISHQLKE